MRYFFLRPLLAGLLMLPVAALAGVGKVSTPAVTEGEFEIEYTTIRYGDDGGNKLNNAQAHVVELEYSFTGRFMLGLELAGERESPQSFQGEAYGVEAQYELTKQGDWWFASAAKAEYAFPFHESDASEGEVKLLLQRRQGPTRWTANINLQREFGANRRHGMELSSALQGLYLWNKHINPGVEWFADYGATNNLTLSNEEGHYLGPVITGELFSFKGGEIEYVAGYYRGLTSASAEDAARLQLSYEIRF